MATIKENRPIPSTGVETEFERGAGTTHYTTVKNQTSGRDDQSMWIYVVIALLVLAGALYYFMGSNATSVGVPETTPPVTSTTPDVVTPPVTSTTPDVVTPPATAPDVVTPPVATPDPAAAPKTTP